MQSAMWLLVFIVTLSQTYPGCAGDSDPRLPCDDDSAVGEALLGCFRTANVEIPVDALMTSVADIFFYRLELICNQKTSVKAGANCGLEIERNCHGVENVPSSSSMEAVLDDLCQISAEINDTCRLQITDDYWQCFEGKAGATLCSGFEAMNECFQTEYMVCGCRTAQIFSDNFIKLMRSTSCQIESMTPLACADGDGSTIVKFNIVSLTLANFITYFVMFGLISP